MTDRAPNWIEQKYIKGVIHELQSEGWTLKTALNSTGEIKAGKAIWKIAGKGVATRVSRGVSHVAIMNADRRTIETTVEDYEANDYIDTLDIEKMSENEMQVAQKTGGSALGRKFDQLVLGAMDAEGASIATIGDGTAALSITHLIEAQAKIIDAGGSPGELYVAMPVWWLAQLELYKEVSSCQYVEDQPMLKKLGARMWKGMTLIPLPEGTTTDERMFARPAANQADGYIWAKDAVGLVPNYALRSRIDYVPQVAQYLALNRMGLGHKVLLPDAVKRLRFATNVALTRQT